MTHSPRLLKYMETLCIMAGYRIERIKNTKYPWIKVTYPSGFIQAYAFELNAIESTYQHLAAAPSIESLTAILESLPCPE